VANTPAWAEVASGVSGLEGLSIEGAAVAALGWAGTRLLGPTFEEIGMDIKGRYSDRRVGNFVRIGRNAEAKAGASLIEPGEVSPRVAMKILEEGSWCDGPVMAEYFGGILANSRSPDGSNDRGLVWAGLVSRLSTEDIHLHYLVYEAFRRLFFGRADLKWGDENVRGQSQLYVSETDAGHAIGKAVDLTPSLTALVREGLLGDKYWSGRPKDLNAYLKVVLPHPGIVVTPSLPGIELFLWAFNQGHRDVTDILSLPPNLFLSQEGLSPLQAPLIVADMRREQQQE
jgi:hypothetical protein